MKKLLTATSPFLMLLIPVFFCIALLLSNNHPDVQAEKSVSTISLHLPTLKKAVIKILF